jgi:hypothetical protein
MHWRLWTYQQRCSNCPSFSNIKRSKEQVTSSDSAITSKVTSRNSRCGIGTFVLPVLWRMPYQFGYHCHSSSVLFHSQKLSRLTIFKCDLAGSVAFPNFAGLKPAHHDLSGRVQGSDICPFSTRFPQGILVFGLFLSLTFLKIWGNKQFWPHQSFACRIPIIFHCSGLCSCFLNTIALEH